MTKTGSILVPIMATNAYHVTSLRHSDVIWRQGSRSTLAQVMACCLTAPSHYLKQCWLAISKLKWHSPERISIRSIANTRQRNKIENWYVKSHSDFPMSQPFFHTWLWHHDWLGNSYQLIDINKWCPTLNWSCDYLSMLGLKLIRVSKAAPDCFTMMIA